MKATTKAEWARHEAQLPKMREERRQEGLRLEKLKVRLLEKMAQSKETGPQAGAA